MQGLKFELSKSVYYNNKNDIYIIFNDNFIWDSHDVLINNIDNIN